MELATFKTLLVLVKTVRSSAIQHPLKWVQLCNMPFNNQHHSLLYDLVWDKGVRRYASRQELLVIDLRGVRAFPCPSRVAAIFQSVLTVEYICRHQWSLINAVRLMLSGVLSIFALSLTKSQVLGDCDHEPITSLSHWLLQKKAMKMSLTK